MTVLSVFQSIAPRLGMPTPTAVYGQTQQELIELQVLANEMARRIADAYEWQKLKALHTLTGDDTTEDFSLPSDYDGMLKDTALWSSRIETPLTHIISTDEWLELTVKQYSVVVGVWTIFQDQIHIKPAMLSTETAKFYYRSNKIVVDNSSTTKTAFTADTDSFRLDETCLGMGIIYQWRQTKGLSYAEEMQTYQTRLDRLIEKDSGSRLLVVGQQRIPRGTTIAYPVPITP